ncbi:MAG: SUMF1/EgtB/PvdO family nonheme iron enzyme [Snowella sp.]
MWSNSNESSRLLRGGSWSGYSGLCRSANRLGNDAVIRNLSFGFRLAVPAF